MRLIKSNVVCIVLIKVTYVPLMDLNHRFPKHNLEFATSPHLFIDLLLYLQTKHRKSNDFYHKINA